MRRSAYCKKLVALLASVLATGAAGETKVESDADQRLTLAFHAPATELQKWLPVEWKVATMPSGPAKGANLFFVLVNKLASVAPDGRLLANGGTERSAALVVPGARDGKNETRLFVIRSYTTDPNGLPGPYRNAVVVQMRRHTEMLDEGAGFGTVRESWQIKEARGVSFAVHVAYQRSLPVRGKSELKPYSAVDPDLYRIYRSEQGSEIVKSVAGGIDRLQSYEFRPGVTELANIFDAGTELISVIANPWYVRDVFIP